MENIDLTAAHSAAAALGTVTEPDELLLDHAWHAIHGASDHVCEVCGWGLSGGWVVQYQYDSTWVCLSKERGVPRRFESHRAASIVADRMRKSRVVWGTDETGAEWRVHVIV